MNWRPAKSIEVLKEQLNALFPTRNRVSDGVIGDANHSAKTSDHNPNSKGIVTAFDITNDPIKAIDGARLVKILQASKDPRIKYLIFNGQITVKGDISKWKPYMGLNAHKHHVHISVSSDPRLYDSGAAWKLAGLKNPVPADYTVAAGDTLSAILKRFKITMNDFYDLNDLNADNFDPDNIHVGDVFRIFAVKK